MSKDVVDVLLEAVTKLEISVQRLTAKVEAMDYRLENIEKHLNKLPKTEVTTNG